MKPLEAKGAAQAGASGQGGPLYFQLSRLKCRAHDVGERKSFSLRPPKPPLEGGGTLVAFKGLGVRGYFGAEPFGGFHTLSLGRNPVYSCLHSLLPEGLSAHPPSVTEPVEPSPKHP